MQNSKIFIGGLNYETTEDSLRSKLEEFGTVTSLRIVTDFHTGRSKGFGFATFSKPEEAQKAIDVLHNEIFEGRRIGVKTAVDNGR